MEKLSTVQYSGKSGMSKQLILYYIKNSKPLPAVVKIEVIAGRNILHTDVKKLQRLCKNS